MEKYNLEPYNEKDSYSESAYNRAEKRIKEIKGFYRHLMAFCLFTPFTIFINYKTYWDYKWFWFSIISWGIGLAFHAFFVFVHKGKGVFGREWEKRKIEEFMKEEEQMNKWN